MYNDEQNDHMFAQYSFDFFWGSGILLFGFVSRRGSFLRFSSFGLAFYFGVPLFFGVDKIISGFRGEVQEGGKDFSQSKLEKESADSLLFFFF